MKNRIKILLMTGVLSLSTIGTVQLVIAEEQTANVNLTVKGANEVKNSVEKTESASETGMESTPTEVPTEAPTEEPTEAPTEEPTEAPTEEPTEAPTEEPTEAPTEEPTEAPTEEPTEAPTEISTEEPSEAETTIESEIQTDSDRETESETQKKEKEKEKIDEAAAKKYKAVTGESIYVFGSYPVVDITENTNEIYDYLRNVLGLNHAAACGVLANIQCESNFSSSAVGDGGTSYGLCQWHLGRFSALINWCNANGYEYHSIQGQLSYLTTELQGGYASVYQYLLNVPDTAQGAYDAAYYWCKYFEIPANLEYNSQMRADLAMNLYYPKTLGTREEEKEKEDITLSDDQMEQVLVAAPKNISKLGRLNISKEETVNQALENNNSYTSSGMTTDYEKEVLKEEIEKAVQNALEEYHKKAVQKTKVETNTVSEKPTELTSEDLALLGNSLTRK